MLFTPDDLKAALNAVIQREGNVARAAKKLGIARPSLHRILNGTFEVGDDVANALGYRRVIRYERLPQK